MEIAEPTVNGTETNGKPLNDHIEGLIYPPPEIRSE